MEVLDRVRAVRSLGGLGASPARNSFHSMKQAATKEKSASKRNVPLLKIVTSTVNFLGKKKRAVLVLSSVQTVENAAGLQEFSLAGLPRHGIDFSSSSSRAIAERKKACLCHLAADKPGEHRMCCAFCALCMRYDLLCLITGTVGWF